MGVLYVRVRWARLVMACGPVLWSCLFCLNLAGRAQDTRVVTEPVVPVVCAKLEAQLSTSAGGDHQAAIREVDEDKLDTERIQKAIDGCKAGQAVELAAVSGACAKDVARCSAAKAAFLTGPLELREGVTLLIDKDVTLFGSRDPKVYEFVDANRKPDDPITCGTSRPRPAALPTFSMNAAARPRGGCRPLISINVKNAAIMGEGAIDGRGYARLIGHDYSWWEMARKAQPNDDLYFSTRLIVASHADGLILYKIHLFNSPNYHVTVGGTNGFTAWGVHLQTPTNKALVGTDNEARNTDGIDPGTSQNITIAHSWIDNGDDNVAVKQGISHMSVIDNHFYSGHGMSIGSETVAGQSFLLVDGLTEEHTASGIRIKSNVKRGGPVHDLTYQNVCMKDVPIPIAISPYYTNQTVEPFEDPKYEGDKIPDYKGITLQNIHSMTPGDVLIAGLNADHVTEVLLNDVTVEGIKPGQVHLNFVHAKLGVGGTNFELKGHEVTVDHLGGNYGRGFTSPCAGKFVPMQ